MLKIGPACANAAIKKNGPPIETCQSKIEQYIQQFLYAIMIKKKLDYNLYVTRQHPEATFYSLNRKEYNGDIR